MKEATLTWDGNKRIIEYKDGIKVRGYWYDGELESYEVDDSEYVSENEENSFVVYVSDEN